MSSASLKRCTIRSFIESGNPATSSVAVVSSQVDPSFLATPGFRVQIAARVDVALILLATMAIDARCISRLAACFSAELLTSATLAPLSRIVTSCLLQRARFRRRARSIKWIRACTSGACRQTTRDSPAAFAKVRACVRLQRGEACMRDLA